MKNNILVIGISGRVLSGKSTLAKLLASSLNAKLASFGDYVRSVAVKQGKNSEDRTILQEIGEVLVKTDPKSFCQAVLDSVHWDKDCSLVVDGFRHLEVLNEMKALVTPIQLKLIYIRVEDKTIMERMKTRIRGLMKDLHIVEKHSTELQVKSILKNHADFIVDGSKDISEIQKEVIDWIKTLLKDS